jgi:phosphate starvation-inducible protein PhoH
MRGTSLLYHLDEAQNSSAEQMKMFLTRLVRSKMVVTGDITQVDLRQAPAAACASYRKSSMASTT